MEISEAKPAERKSDDYGALQEFNPLEVMMAKRKMSLIELSEKVELTLSNLSILKTGKAKVIRFSLVP